MKKNKLLYFSIFKDNFRYGFYIVGVTSGGKKQNQWRREKIISLGSIILVLKELIKNYLIDYIYIYNKFSNFSEVICIQYNKGGSEQMQTKRKEKKNKEESKESNIMMIFI
jgi:hypothetical protein